MAEKRPRDEATADTTDASAVAAVAVIDVVVVGHVCGGAAGALWWRAW